MNFPLTTTQSHILDAKGEEIGSLYDFPDETNAREIVRLANLGHRVLKEACAAFPPSLIVEISPEEWEALGHLSGRKETPPVAGSEPASTEVYECHKYEYADNGERIRTPQKQHEWVNSYSGIMRTCRNCFTAEKLR